MKKKRKSAVAATQIGNKDEQIQQIQQMVPYITYLPRSIFHTVLLKLPTKSIVMCKCVCKTWYELISDPEFAKLHFAHAEACLMVRDEGPSSVSRTLYLLEAEDNFGSVLKDYGTSKRNVQRHLHMNIAKCKIPLRNAEEVINTHNNVNVKLNRTSGIKRKPCIKINPENQRYKLVNSCNGLLCLSEPSSNDPFVVCNPITGEFINLPKASKDEGENGSIRCGLGFSPKTNQYKVVRIFQQGNPRSIRLAEIHTLGTGSWTCLGRAPPSAAHMPDSPTYLKGALYWYFCGRSLCHIDSFDLENGTFQSVPPPPCEMVKIKHCVSMGVLGGSLSLFHIDYPQSMINVWVMKDYGAQKSWTKQFSVTFNHERWLFGVCPTVEFLRGGPDGVSLMFPDNPNVFIYYHPGNRTAKCFKLRWLLPNFVAVSHVPSFISLKDILIGSNVEVLNINSRCAEWKLLGQGEHRALGGRKNSLVFYELKNV